MIIEGNGFKYFFNNEEKTKEEIEKLANYATNITVGNGVVNYFSPKKKKEEIKLSLDNLKYFMVNENSTEKDLTDVIHLITAENKEDLGQRFAEIKLKNVEKEDKNKKASSVEQLLKEVNKHQEQNGGRDVNMEFPFDAVLTPTKKYNNDLFVPGFGFIHKRGKIFKYDKIAEKENTKEAKKETEGKLFYELDFEFIKQMAERMQSNKDNDKYELWNWKKSMTPRGIEALKQAMWRHIIAVMQGEFEDDGREFGHLEAISNNAMMINYQLKK